MSNQRRLCKLIQAYTDEAGQVVDPAIIKAVQDADRIYILAAGNILPCRICF